MKPAMKQFIETYSEILKKFRITGTQTTMKMCKSMWGEDDPSIHYGLACTSGPLGGDAEMGKSKVNFESYFVLLVMLPTLTLLYFVYISYEQL